MLKKWEVIKIKTVRVGSRDSRLALAQTKIVIDEIKRYDPSIKIELITMKTKGDKILDKTLDKIGGKGLFLKELEEALIDKKVDITVHSYKDIPMEVNKDLPVVALSKREDERDVLILPKGKKNSEKPLGTCSKRRSVQLKQLGFENIAPLRGNVITRLKKLDDGEYSSIVVAYAGLKRLGIEKRVSSYFPVNEIIPPAGQGILAVQARKGEDTGYLKNFHNATSYVLSEAERAFVTALDGGCSCPIAAHAYLENDVLVLNGLYVDEGKNVVLRGKRYGHSSQAVQIGIELANSLKKKGDAL